MKVWWYVAKKSKNAFDFINCEIRNINTRNYQRLEQLKIQHHFNNIHNILRYPQFRYFFYKFWSFVKHSGCTINWNVESWRLVLDSWLCPLICRFFSGSLFKMLMLIAFASMSSVLDYIFYWNNRSIKHQQRGPSFIFTISLNTPYHHAHQYFSTSITCAQCSHVTLTSRSYMSLTICKYDALAEPSMILIILGDIGENLIHQFCFC